MEVQAGVAASIARSQVGREVEALLEEQIGPTTFVGRTATQAPEIDGTIRVEGDGASGDVVRVRIVGADVYDLSGAILPAVDSAVPTP
jgi:tRNA A37 methylthiotransferase MiaB